MGVLVSVCNRLIEGNGMIYKCVLSGLEIPKGKKNIEHYCPKSRVPRSIWNNPANLFYAYKVLNFVKGELMPCEWEEQKFELTYYAIRNWNIKEVDRKFLKQTLKHWERWSRNPCDLCLMKCKGR